MRVLSTLHRELMPIITIQWDQSGICFDSRFLFSIFNSWVAKQFWKHIYFYPLCDISVFTIHRSPFVSIYRVLLSIIFSFVGEKKIISVYGWCLRLSVKLLCTLDFALNQFLTSALVWSLFLFHVLRWITVVYFDLLCCLATTKIYRRCVPHSFDIFTTPISKWTKRFHNTTHRWRITFKSNVQIYQISDFVPGKKEFQINNFANLDCRACIFLLHLHLYNYLEILWIGSMRFHGIPQIIMNHNEWKVLNIWTVTAHMHNAHNQIKLDKKLDCQFLRIPDLIFYESIKSLKKISFLWNHIEKTFHFEAECCLRLEDAEKFTSSEPEGLEKWLANTSWQVRHNWLLCNFLCNRIKKQKKKFYHSFIQICTMHIVHYT